MIRSRWEAYLARFFEHFQWEWLRHAGLIAVLVVPGAAGQSLALSSAGGAAGEYVNLEIAFQAPPDSATVALQWELAIPSASVELLPEHIARELVPVQEAGKSLMCAVVSRSGEEQVVRCILAGGPKSIPTGKIVLVPLRISPRAQPGSVRIRLQAGLRVSRDSKQAALEAAETTLAVRTH